MSRRGVLIIVIVLIICFYVGRGMFWLPSISSHEGDGTFRDLSHRAGPLAVRGYCISMPEFDLANPYQAEYRLANLPNIGKECGVHLAIRDHDDRLWGETQGFDGRLELEMLDKQRHSVLAVRGRLGDFIWWCPAPFFLVHVV